MIAFFGRNSKKIQCENIDLNVGLTASPPCGKKHPARQFQKIGE
jgi:hypothetical protein